MDALGSTKPKLPRGAGKFAVQPTDSIIKLSRVGEDGAIIAEEWSVDRNGKPAKLISKNIQVQAQDSPIASSKTDVVVGEEYVIKEITRKDGSAVRHVYDKNTGKLIETHEGEAPAPKGGKRTAAETPEKSAFAQPVGSSDRDGLGIDLVALAAAYADAVSDLEAAEADLAGMEKGPGHPEARVAQTAVNRAARKERTLKAILTVAAETAHAKRDRLRELYQKGSATERSMAEAERQCKMLDAILKSLGADQKNEPVNIDTPRAED